MARTAEDSATAAPAAATAPAAAATGSRPKVELVIDKEAAEFSGIKEGEKVGRKEFCVKSYLNGKERGPISKQLTRLEGREVAYQIVFQALKGTKRPEAAAAE